ncbi:uncharacterized protein LOC112969108 [Apteryx rowi]|uniref:uncharacterized protein LOC112969108 n=1 Tax=Apteryx rowi TaxID=308060 RepID=UPI0006B106AC|nr:PREDICTED: uncharacterized protein LOC106489688 [Apteryx mantelli mantelli]XP_013804381.1 PREDICTED: uncharacterized protein LOC106489688 [Apteryx mantelli mantelli]XP_025927812.1 uncharacterized protein LOC112969108 [Apteryx rowi]
MTTARSASSVPPKTFERPPHYTPNTVIVPSISVKVSTKDSHQKVSLLGKEQTALRFYLGMCPGSSSGSGSFWEPDVPPITGWSSPTSQVAFNDSQGPPLPETLHTPVRDECPEGKKALNAIRQSCASLGTRTFVQGPQGAPGQEGPSEASLCPQTEEEHFTWPPWQPLREQTTCRTPPSRTSQTSRLFLQGSFPLYHGMEEGMQAKPTDSF